MIFLVVVTQVAIISSSAVGLDTCTSPSHPCCPPMWVHWNDSCYRVTQKVPALQAQSICRELGGQLLAPRSAEENEFITTIIPKGEFHVSIGCDDRKTEGVWVCNGQTVVEDTFTNWLGGTPATAYNQGVNDCAILVYDAKWYAYSCTDEIMHVTCRMNVGDASHYGRSLSHTFAISDEGRVITSNCLAGHVMKEFQTSSDPQCAAACILEPGCRSFNIKHIETGQRLCQLNNSTYFEDPNAFHDFNFCKYADACAGHHGD